MGKDRNRTIVRAEFTATGSRRRSHHLSQDTEDSDWLLCSLGGRKDCLEPPGTKGDVVPRDSYLSTQGLDGTTGPRKTESCRRGKKGKEALARAVSENSER